MLYALLAARLHWMLWHSTRSTCPAVRTWCFPTLAEVSRQKDYVTCSAYVTCYSICFTRFGHAFLFRSSVDGAARTFPRGYANQTVAVCGADFLSIFLSAQSPFLNCVSQLFIHLSELLFLSGRFRHGEALAISLMSILTSSHSLCLLIIKRARIVSLCPCILCFCFHVASTSLFPTARTNWLH